MLTLAQRHSEFYFQSQRFDDETRNELEEIPELLETTLDSATDGFNDKLGTKLSISGNSGR